MEHGRQCKADQSCRPLCCMSERPSGLLFGGLPRPVPSVAIVGAGYVGLTAAYVLARGGARVVVFERGTVGAGASARNAGFCTISPPFSASGLVATEGHDGARRWLQWFRSAVERVEALAGELSTHARAPIGFRRVGRLRLAETMAQAASLRQEAELQACLGAPVRFIEGRALSERMPLGRAVGAIVDEESARLDPAALLDALSAAAQKAGATVAEHCAVQRAVDHGSDRIQVLHAKGTTTARALVVATNGYTDEAFPPFRDFVVPVGSFIVVTDPIEPDCALGDLDRGRVASTSYRFPHYFRVLDDRRLLFGGRASLALQTDLDTCAQWLLERARCVLAPINVRTATACWGGQLAFTLDRRPLLGTLDNRRFYAMGCAGHGVPTSIGCAYEIAASILDNAVSAPFWRGPSRPPSRLPRIARRGLPVAQAYLRLRDAMDARREGVRRMHGNRRPAMSGRVRDVTR
jgi:glycine/D-amino acid oxidase-like deaminating enzyme